jgi:hypothetical protein
MDKKKSLLRLFINPCINYSQNVLIPINITTPTEIIVSSILFKYGLAPKVIMIVLLFI